MLCPKCKQNTYVIDSRDVEAAVRRRRECEKCAYRFTTHERLEPITIAVIKRDGSQEPYSREKIRKGIELACQKRTISEQTVDDIVDTIEAQILEIGDNEIPSKKIGELVIEKLRTLDDVAYLRFASVYKAFKSAKSFEKELAKLTK